MNLRRGYCKQILINDEDWAFTSMDTKIGTPTFHTWGLKSIKYPHSIHTYLSVIASNEFN